MADQNEFFRARRIGLCGSQRPASIPFAAFCNEVGKTLSEIDGTIVAIAGRKHGVDSDDTTADVEFLRGVQEASPSGNVSGRVQTFQFRNEEHPEHYFQAGTVIEIDGAVREARRFAMVHAVDGLVGVGGGRGTGQQLTFALATETPALPIPSFGGQGLEIWNEHEQDLIDQLELSSAMVKRWKTRPTTKKAAANLAREMMTRFVGTLQHRCFVIMPFATDFSPLIDFVIDPVVCGMGDQPIHLGRLKQPGDVGRQISEGIAKADYVICVLDGMRPNVLYELGISHALGKPTILLWKRSADPDLAPPFDIAKEQRIEYVAVDNALRPELEKAIRHVRTRHNPGQKSTS